MDIDITDPAFSLGISDVNQAINNNANDNTMILYIGAGLIVLFIGMFVYKFYMNKQSTGNEETSHTDCPGGFCVRPDISQP